MATYDISDGAELRYYLSGAFHKVPGTKKVTAPAVEVMTADVSNLDSRVKLSIPGMTEPGTISATILYDVTVFNTVYGFLGIVMDWQVADNNSGGAWTAEMFMTKCSPSFDVGDDSGVVFEVELKLTEEAQYSTSAGGS